MNKENCQQSPQFPQLKTRFFYLIGNTQQIRKWNLKKILFDENFSLKNCISYDEFLQQKMEDVPSFVPRVMGIYQDSYLVNETPEEKREREETNRFRRFGEKDGCVYDLINIIYNTKNWLDAKFIRDNLGDISGRITINTIEEIPNFYEKDVNELFLITHNYVKDFEELKNKDSKYVENERLYDLILKKRYGSQAEKLIEKWRKFGITKSEYLDLTALEL